MKGAAGSEDPEDLKNVLDPEAKNKVQTILDKLSKSKQQNWLATAGIMDLDEATMDSLSKSLESKN